MPPLPTKYTSKQYGGQKAKFTKAIEVLESTTKEIEEDIGYVTTSTEREKLTKYLTQAEEAIEKVQEFLEVHGEHEAEQVRNDHTYVDEELKAQADDHNEKHKKLAEMQAKIQKLVRKFDQDVEKAKMESQTHRRTSSHSRSPSKKDTPKFILSRDDEKFRLSDALKPDRLSHEARYLEFLNWQKNATSYAEINAISSKPHKVQVSALNGIVDEHLENHLGVHFNGVEEAPVFSEQNTSYMHAIKVYFQIKYPKPMRIFDYITATQAVNESIPAWTRRVEGLAIAAEAEDLKPDEWLKFKIVTGIEYKQSLRDKLLLKCAELDLQKIKEKINEDAATEAMAKSLEKSSQLYAISQYSRDKAQTRQQGYRPNHQQFRHPPQPRGPPRPQHHQNRPTQPPALPRGQQAYRTRATFDLKCRKCNITPFWNCRTHFRGDQKIFIERFVNIAKTMIKKARNQDHLADMVMNYNQCANSSGLSPNQILLRHNVRTRLPMLKSAFRTIRDEEVEKAVRDKENEFKKQEARFNRNARDLPELQIGQLVRIYNFRTKQWDTRATVINKDKNRSYQVRTETSSVLWRNRRFVKELRRGLTEFHQTSAGSCLASSASFKSSSRSSSFESLNFKRSRLRERRWR